jgi:hypothetical protein
MFNFVILGLIILGCCAYLFKYGFAKKKTGFALIKDKGLLDKCGNMAVQGVSKNGKTYIRILVSIENKTAEFDIPQNDFHKYNIGQKIPVEYRINKLGTITYVKEINNHQPIVIKINNKPKSNKYENNSKDYWQ